MFLQRRFLLWDIGLPATKTMGKHQPQNNSGE
jgi:hypothetical protein